MNKQEPTWLDAHHGWDESGNVVDTYWIGDPAIDEAKSDADAYFSSFDPAHLVVKPGAKPVRMVIRLPDAVQWVEISTHLQSDLPLPVALARASVCAFGLCVRFPEVESAAPVYRFGAERLPEGFLRQLRQKDDRFFARIGAWLIVSYTLTDDEKKASSQGSGEKTSSSSPTTTATDATPGVKHSRGARTSAKKRGRKQKTP